MAQSSVGYIDQFARSNWIKLRTLVIVRWFAIAGQSLACLVAQFYVGIDLPVTFCALVIGASVLVNLISMTRFPGNRRLTENEAVGVLAFDVVQICLLLAVTGGIHNPFVLLVLAPVTIATSALPSRVTFILAGLAIVLVTLIAYFNVPLTLSSGRELAMPDIFAFGLWIAIVIGVGFIAVYNQRVTAEMTSMSEALLATQMALAREQKLTDLGGVVAATAHELGTPLATIKLVSAELMEELEQDNDLHADASLIRDQAVRCSNILKSMGRAGKDDMHLRSAPWRAVVEEAAEPHMTRGPMVDFILDPNAPGEDPLILRKPEIIHGIRNIIQNAVDFAQHLVEVEITWTKKEIKLTIRDDGGGFSPMVIDRLGDPFVRRRQETANLVQRAGYEGMGLGLFIAKTLLERSGAKLLFRNDSEEGETGAVVEMSWDRRDVETKPLQGADNPPITGSAPALTSD